MNCVALETGVQKLNKYIFCKISLNPYGANYGGTKWCKWVKNSFSVFTQKQPNPLRIRENKKPSNFSITRFTIVCGEIGIRTPGTSRFNSFQDCRNRPLCHFSRGDKIKLFFYSTTNFLKYFLLLNLWKFTSPQ